MKSRSIGRGTSAPTSPIAEKAAGTRHRGVTCAATWTGTPLQALAERGGVRPEARYVRFDSFDRDYYNSWDLESAFHPETFLAWEFNDEVLGPDHGPPSPARVPRAGLQADQVVWFGLRARISQLEEMSSGA